MDFQITNQRFLVFGASSGFGRAIAEGLLNEGARVIVTARREDKLNELLQAYPNQTHVVTGDVLEDSTLETLASTVNDGGQLHGVVLNSGGPPATAAVETGLELWDEAYHSVMRWKIDFLYRILPHLLHYQYGRILLVESQSIKQPIPNLTLSNAYRAGIAGFAKTLARELAPKGITTNILAPGPHDTPAIKRVIEKQSDTQNITFDEARTTLEQGIPVQRMGKAEELASLALWLLSPHSAYVTGQTLSHDGGNNQSLWG